MDKEELFQAAIKANYEDPENIYRERARLIAFITRIFPSHGTYENLDEPGWLVVFVDTPEGQLSWQIHPDDEDLFSDLRLISENKWDGHTTKEKYERLARLGRRNRNNPATVDRESDLYDSFRAG